MKPVDINTKIVDYKRNLTIIDIEYKSNIYNIKGRKKSMREKYYKYKCNICGWDNGLIRASDLNKGAGCSCCAGKTVVEGINDIPTVAPYMVKYFQGGYDEAKLYSIGSKKKNLSYMS